MDRVRGDVGIASAKDDVDDNEVVNVLNVGANLLLVKTFLESGLDDDVAGRAICDLVARVSFNVKLTIGPLDFDLYQTISLNREGGAEGYALVSGEDKCRSASSKPEIQQHLRRVSLSHISQVAGSCSESSRP